MWICRWKWSIRNRFSLESQICGACAPILPLCWLFIQSAYWLHDPNWRLDSLETRRNSVIPATNVLWPDSNPEDNGICEMILLAFVAEGFSLGLTISFPGSLLLLSITRRGEALGTRLWVWYSEFFPSSATNISKFQLDPKSDRHRVVSL